MTYYYLLCQIVPHEGAQAAQQIGRSGAVTVYWWRGPDGTRYYTPPLRGRRVVEMAGGLRAVEVPA